MTKRLAWTKIWRDMERFFILQMTPASRIISIPVKLLLRRCPGIELIIAFADQGENYHGGIYQASNLIYTGTTHVGRLFKHKLTGRILPNRAVSVNGYRSHFGH